MHVLNVVVPPPCRKRKGCFHRLVSRAKLRVSAALSSRMAQPVTKDESHLDYIVIIIVSIPARYPDLPVPVAALLRCCLSLPVVAGCLRCVYLLGALSD